MVPTGDQIIVQSTRYVREVNADNRLINRNTVFDDQVVITSRVVLESSDLLIRCIRVIIMVSPITTFLIPIRATFAFKWRTGTIVLVHNHKTRVKVTLGIPIILRIINDID